MSDDARPEAVLIDVADHVGTITLNAPERLNALDANMIQALTAAVRDLDADPQVRVIVLTGAGRGFCSGAALSNPEAGVPTKTLFAIGTLMRALTRSRTVTVALVNGVAAGVGCSIAVACHYVLACESASFMLAFTRIGLMPDGGATALIAASVGRARAQRLALTAEKLPAPTAYEWGLIAEVTPDAEFDARGRALLEMLSSGAPLALGTTARAINDATLTELDAALAREESGQLALFGTNDFVEGTQAFLTKRAARFAGT